MEIGNVYNVFLEGDIILIFFDWLLYIEFILFFERKKKWSLRRKEEKGKKRSLLCVFVGDLLNGIIGVLRLFDFLVRRKLDFNVIESVI